MKTIIKSGKHSVLVLATEENYITVQLKNGAIHSFKTEYDFSPFKDLLAGAVIDIIVKGRGKNKEISLADDVLKNILNDELLVTLIEEKEFIDTIITDYEKASSLSFNETCCFAEERIKEAAKEKKMGIKNLAKGVAPRIFTNKIILTNMDIFFYIMAKEALDMLTEERIQSVCAVSLIDSELIPIAQQQRNEHLQEIKERIAELSSANANLEKLAPKNIVAKIGMVTETPILVVAESGERFEIDTQRMTPEAYWCLLVEKSLNEKCNFLLYDNGKVVPNTKLETPKMPDNAYEEMNYLGEYQDQLVSLYEITSEKRRLIRKIGREILALSASERTSDENLEYSNKKYEKSRLKKELSSYENEINDIEVTIADLKIHWQKKIGK